MFLYSASLLDIGMLKFVTDVNLAQYSTASYSRIGCRIWCQLHVGMVVDSLWPCDTMWSSLLEVMACRQSIIMFTTMTSSNGNIFRVTDPLCGEFTGPGEFPTQRPVTRSFDVFFDLRLNKRVSKQPWGWWFETLSWSLWRHCNANVLAPDGTKPSTGTVLTES